MNLLNEQINLINRISKDLNTNTKEMPSKISSILKQLKDNEKIQTQLKSQLALNQTDELIKKQSK